MNSDESPTVPQLAGTRVRLRPIEQSDLEFLYQVSMIPQNAFRWRTRGTILDRQDFLASLKTGVLVQFVVEKKVSALPVGLITAYNANQRDGFVYISGISEPSLIGTGLVIEGLLLLVTYLFDVWPFRKIYIESIEFNATQFRNVLGQYLTEEARLKEHTYHGDRYWDTLTFAIYRQDWHAFMLAHESRGESSSSEIDPESDGSTSTAESDDLLTLDEFCVLIATEIPPPVGKSSPVAEHRLQEDLGYDSFSLLELTAIIESLAGSPDLEWPDRFETMRDLYLWYTTAASAPRAS
jgi:RimJ/RimL family protein N-acetyltransferase